MRAYNKLKIELTDEEKNKLCEAAEILKGIVDLLENNQSNGHTPFQEGLDITYAFWDLANSFKTIEKEDLIP